MFDTGERLTWTTEIASQSIKIPLGGHAIFQACGNGAKWVSWRSCGMLHESIKQTIQQTNQHTNERRIERTNKRTIGAQCIILQSWPYLSESTCFVAFPSRYFSTRQYVDMNVTNISAQLQFHTGSMSIPQRLFFSLVLDPIWQGFSLSSFRCEAGFPKECNKFEEFLVRIND